MTDHWSIGRWSSANWFLLVLPLLLVVEFAFSRGDVWTEPELAEAAVLFDLCLFIPALYLLCYRRTHSARQLLLRAVALLCLGILVASYLVPTPAQRILPYLSVGRYFGLAVLALIELAIIVRVVKMLYRDNASAEEVALASGAPRWIARLLEMEARFWKAVWNFLRLR